MAKGVILEDKITGGQILPVTSSDLVFDPVNNKTQKELNDEFSKEKAVLVKDNSLEVRSISKKYNTEAEALADKNPIDTATSLPLTVGQFVSIVDDGEKNGIYRIGSISGDGTMSLELQGKLGDLSPYAKHGYESNPKTLKEVDDNAGVKIENLVVNGDFRNGTMGWTASKTSSFTAANNEATFIGNGSWAEMKSSFFSRILNNKYYVRANVKADNTDTVLSVDSSTESKVVHSGSGNYELLSRVFVSDIMGTSNSLYISDTRESGWTTVSVKNAALINLTQTFGAGNEPTKEEFELLLATLGTDYFEGEITIPTQKIMQWRLKLGNTSAQNADNFSPIEPVKNLIVNAGLNGTTGWTVANGTLTTSNGEGAMLPPRQWGEVWQDIPRIIGHKYYISVEAKATFNLLIRNHNIVIATHTGSNTYERLSSVVTATSDIESLRLTDTRESGWDTFYFKTFQVFDLTSIFGEGNEPAIKVFEELLNKYNNGFIEKSSDFNKIIATYFERNAKQLLVDTSTYIAENLIKNSNFTSQRYWSGLRSTVSITDNELSFIGTVPGDWAEIRQSMPSDRGTGLFYFQAKVKSTSNQVSFTDDGAVVGIGHTGSGEYETLYAIRQNPAANFDISDRRTTGEVDTVYVKEAMLLNLTTIFGAGNEPDERLMKAIIDEVGFFPDFKNLDRAVERNKINLLSTKVHDSISHFDFKVSSRTPSLANSATISIIDDDGYMGALTGLFPFFQERDVPFGVAIITSWMNSDSPGKVNREQVVYLKNNGVEIMSHTVNHLSLGLGAFDMTLEGIEYEMRQSKNDLMEIGCNPHSLVLPYGNYTDETLQIAAKHYSATYHFEMLPFQIMNFGNMVNHRIRRYDFDQGLEHLKAAIDEAVATNGWLVITTHVGTYNWLPTSYETLDAAITYAKSLGVKFLLPKDAFQIYGNFIEADNGFKIAANGTITPPSV